MNRLGESSAEVYQAWIRLSQEDHSPCLIGARLGICRYLYQQGQIWNLHLYYCDDGAIVSGLSELTPVQVDALLEGFAEDDVHIELRHRTGALGLWRNERADELVKILHQAKGKFDMEVKCAKCGGAVDASYEPEHAYGGNYWIAECGDDCDGQSYGTTATESILAYSQGKIEKS